MPFLPPLSNDTCTTTLTSLASENPLQLQPFYAPTPGGYYEPFVTNADSSSVATPDLIDDSQQWHGSRAPTPGGQTTIEKIEWLKKLIEGHSSSEIQSETIDLTNPEILAQLIETAKTCITDLHVISENTAQEYKHKIAIKRKDFEYQVEALKSTQRVRQNEKNLLLQQVKEGKDQAEELRYEIRRITADTNNLMPCVLDHDASLTSSSSLDSSGSSESLDEKLQPFYAPTPGGPSFSQEKITSSVEDTSPGWQGSQPPTPGGSSQNDLKYSEHRQPSFVSEPPSAGIPSSAPFADEELECFARQLEEIQATKQIGYAKSPEIQESTPSESMQYTEILTHHMLHIDDLQIALKQEMAKHQNELTHVIQGLENQIQSLKNINIALNDEILTLKSEIKSLDELNKKLNSEAFRLEKNKRELQSNMRRE